MPTIDAFWLPQEVRAKILEEQTAWAQASFAGGRPCAPEDSHAVTVRWPVLDREQWARLLGALRSNRRRMPTGQEYRARFQTAMKQAGRRLADPTDPLHQQALAALPEYTGYSGPMIAFTLGALDLWALDQLHRAFALDPTCGAAEGWQPLDGLPGRMRFFRSGGRRHLPGRLVNPEGRPLFGPPSPPELVVGYGAGNVPGTALLIAVLAQTTAFAGGRPPAAVVRNSRREPIFAPLFLSALEATDPELVASVAVLIWDYEDREIQSSLLSEADLAIAAASDETIARIAGDIRSTAGGQGTRFHAHGHKVSFSAIGREVLAHGLRDPGSERPLLEMVVGLAALDSVFWDQQGCLSSRVHFVEVGTTGQTHTPSEYGEQLATQMRLLETALPRGAWPRRWLHERYDQLRLLETTGQVQLFSAYDDAFVVALDQRPLDAAGFRTLVNQCAGRVIIVRPVADLMELPGRYLPSLPAANLQTLSVAVGQAGGGLSGRFLAFAEACAGQGVTAIRTVGRGAFPQLAYSWDGWIPLDLIRPRPAGRFATIEFEQPYDDMAQTYRLFQQQGVGLGLGRS